MSQSKIHKIHRCKFKVENKAKIFKTKHSFLFIKVFTKKKLVLQALYKEEAGVSNTLQREDGCSRHRLANKRRK